MLLGFHSATREAGGKKSIACFKRALVSLDVVSCAAVAEGTGALSSEEADAFDAAFERVRRHARDQIGAPRVSVGSLS